ncbi:MAG: chloride channel protein [Sodaliphilus pleomorphus]|jgi:CIC family chloride channel protein|uniref:chloride channel protein n=1 Tax=Sodaliphilus pleomorphus TaxID=2606626 RepID=UPI0023F40FAC|nr:chloride channel protein [Sodaliphilus pleomorphus]MDD7065478.1 chloride channel protein [Sodaliphilus pleomorphus]MDY2832268.1 chloride channel protein [Sodaliphilus pleomorphus]MDY6252545.1 chloride channel protein [Bacteroidales bacterium]MDY6260390.1 chloride channel protein [Bacteroidales bacterium]
MTTTAEPEITTTAAASSNEKESKGWYLRLILWREKHIPEKTFVVMLAIVIGIASGLAAVLLKFLISTISTVINSVGVTTQANYYYLLFPIVGILLSGLYVRYVVRDNISHGVTRVLYAIAQKKSRLKTHNMYASLVASSITIGCGGSVGAEGPIVFTGAAIGSNLGQAFRLSPHLLMMLVGCGAAAGIAGIFKAPIAGVLFTVEVLMLDLTAGSVMPLIMASVAGATVSYVFTGYNVEFFFSQSEPFYTSRIPYVIVLGVMCGFVSLYFNKTIGLMEDVFGRMQGRWQRFMLGSVVLSVLIFLFPPLFGEGYGAINNLLNGDVASIFDNSLFYSFRNNTMSTILFVGGLCLFKSFATSATNGGGGVGGTFAPSLYVGCMAGFFFAYTLNAVGFASPSVPLSIKNFALLGMAGVMAGVMQAPLMAIFLTAEMTGGYSLFLPLLIVAAISYGTCRVFTPYSIYTKRLAKRGELLTHQKDQSVLTLLKMDSVIETDFIPVHPDMCLKQMVDVISKSKRNLFPVTDNDNNLLGVVLLDDIRNIMFRPDLYRRMKVERFMSMPPAKVELGTPMEKVMKTFDDTKAWNLPVVDKGKYVGFVSKSKIFNSYRQVLKHYSYD